MNKRGEVSFLKKMCMLLNTFWNIISVELKEVWSVQMPQAEWLE